MARTRVGGGSDEDDTTDSGSTSDSGSTDGSSSTTQTTTSTSTTDPARQAARRRREETDAEDRRGSSSGGDSSNSSNGTGDSNTTGDDSTGDSQINRSRTGPPEEGVGGPPGTVRRDDGSVGPAEPDVDFDRTNPRYGGDVHSQVEDQLLDQGASNIEYAETEGGLVARYETDGQTRYTSVAFEEGAAGRPQSVAGDLARADARDRRQAAIEDVESRMDERADVREQTAETGVEIARFEAGQAQRAEADRLEDVVEGRAAPETLSQREIALQESVQAREFAAGQEAQRRAEEQNEAFMRGNLGDTNEIIAEQAAAQASERYGFEVSPNEVHVSQAGDGVRVTIDRGVAEAGRMAQQAEQNAPGTVDVRRTADGEFDVLVEGPNESTSRDLSRQLESELDDTVVSEQERRARRPAEGEQFGDIDWSFGFGGPGDEVEETVDSGIRASEAAVEAAGGVAGGFGRGAAAIATTPMRLPGLGLEAIETGAYVADGDSSKRARQVTHEGVMRVGQAYSYYLENPIEGGTMLAGSLAASAGLTSAASRALGPRAGTATRYSIQPGEEVARAAGARALGVDGGTTTVTQPGTRTGWSDVRQGVADAMPDRSGWSRSTPGPRVRVESDPEAPVLDIDPELKQQLADYGTQIRETPRRVGSATRSRVQSGRETLSDVEVGDVASSVQAGGERAVEGVRQTGDVVVGGVESGAEVVAGGVKSGTQAARKQYTKTGLLAEDAGYRAGVRTREAMDRVASMDVRDLGSPRFGNALDTAQQEYTRALIRLGDAGYRTRKGFGDAVNTVEQLPGRVTEASGETLSELNQRARQEYTRKLLQTEDIGYRAREGFGDAVDTIEQLPEQAADFSGEALSNLNQRTRQEYTRALLRGGDAKYRAGQYTGEQIGRLVNAEMPDLSSAARRELMAARFGASERARSARETAGRLSDLTIRVGEPERNTIFEVEEPDAIRSPWGDELGIESDAETKTESESAFDTDDAETTARDDTTQFEEGESDIESGDQLLKQRSGSQSEVEADATSRPIAETSQRRRPPFEVAEEPATGGRLDDYVGGEQVEETGGMLSSRISAGAESTEIREQAEGAEVSVGDELEVMAEPEAESVARGPRLGVDAGVREETGTRTDTRTELALEQGERLALTMESEPPGGGRIAFESFDDDDPSRDDGGLSVGFGGTSSPGDGLLASGWLSETVTTIATGGRGPTRELSQSQLADQSLGAQLTGELPTYAMLEGDAETQERIADVQNLLGGFGTAESDDSEGWF
jgi:hypothetical protein